MSFERVVEYLSITRLHISRLQAMNQYSIYMVMEFAYSSLQAQALKYVQMAYVWKHIKCIYHIPYMYYVWMLYAWKHIIVDMLHTAYVLHVGVVCLKHTICLLSCICICTLYPAFAYVPYLLQMYRSPPRHYLTSRSSVNHPDTNPYRHRYARPCDGTATRYIAPISPFSYLPMMPPAPLCFTFLSPYDATGIPLYLPMTPLAPLCCTRTSSTAETHGCTVNDPHGLRIED